MKRVFGCGATDDYFRRLAPRPPVARIKGPDRANYMPTLRTIEVNRMSVTWIRTHRTTRMNIICTSGIFVFFGASPRAPSLV